MLRHPPPWPAPDRFSYPFLGIMEVRLALYQNDQWAVTDWGLTSVKPSAPMEYEILAATLLDKGGSANKFYDWPGHVGEKTWVDYDMFADAFREAIKHHAGKYSGTVDLALLDASIRDGRQQSANR